MVDFNKLRFDRTHHLGLGDVRLTIGQQQEIEAEIAALRARVEALEEFVRVVRDTADSAEEREMADALLEQKP